LDYAGLVCNFNTRPHDTKPPANPSAIRLGTPWPTTRGMGKTEMEKIAGWITRVMTICTPWPKLTFADFSQRASLSGDLRSIATEVKKLCQKFPLSI
jgi:glycine hydroxymethyltransferase